MVFTDGLSGCFKTPCVVFAGHPSLRYGDVVHFMELWGKSSGNTVIFTGTCIHQIILSSLLPLILPSSLPSPSPTPPFYLKLFFGTKRTHHTESKLRQQTCGSAFTTFSQVVLLRDRRHILEGVALIYKVPRLQSFWIFSNGTLPILVPFWVIIISFVFLYHSKLLIWAPLIWRHFFAWQKMA